MANRPYKIEVLETSNLLKNKCTIRTPLHRKALGVAWGREQVGVEYLEVVTDDSNSVGHVPARQLYEELHKRYGKT